MRRAEPNAGHHAVARLGADLVITQNVDGLHERVGTADLVALHGRIADVICLDCGRVTPRAALQQRLTDANPGWAERHADVAVRPDGDVALEETDGFVVPACEVCGGPLKPDVVFFGENVPKPRVARCYAAVDALTPEDGALLVAGSSLTVMSGLRFVRRAARLGVPVVIVNRGTTRGDDLATVRLDTGTSEWLPLLAGLRSENQDLLPA
jgi:NAD-dependent SIR2 family protein deacetylase